MNSQTVAYRFLAVSMIWLIAGLLIGLVGALQYLLPDFLFQSFAFHKSRPVHVTLVITWIFHAATGGLYYYLPEASLRKLYSSRLAHIHLLLSVFTTLLIIGCYFTGHFGGREYLEYPPVIGLLVALSWILFLINFVMTVSRNIKSWAVYHWMWMTGILFFLFIYAESFLWQFSFFGNQVVRDITIQWKSLGSLVGCWNMLIYGTAFYVMEKISGNRKTANAPLTFFFYFLGLTNLLFNWGHHTYIVPAAPWIKHTSYIISMTELLILGSILWNWRHTLDEARQNFHSMPCRFLSAADVWIFLNLALAIAISVPALNLHTHGTHITVAHAMGATIGINSMILAASTLYILSREAPEHTLRYEKQLKTGFWLINSGLFIFWCSLLSAGIIKAYYMEPGSTAGFSQSMEKSYPAFLLFFGSGIVLISGFLLFARAPLQRFIKLSVKKS